MEEDDLLVVSQYNGIPGDSCLLELRLHQGRVQDKKVDIFREKQLTTRNRT
jgi:hypothetical protein